MRVRLQHRSLAKLEIEGVGAGVQNSGNHPLTSGPDRAGIYTDGRCTYCIAGHRSDDQYRFIGPSPCVVHILARSGCRLGVFVLLVHEDRRIAEGYRASHCARCGIRRIWSESVNQLLARGSFMKAPSVAPKRHSGRSLLRNRRHLRVAFHGAPGVRELPPEIRAWRR